MTDEILNIQDTAQIFVDDSGLSASRGFVRNFHPAVKPSPQPVISKTVETGGAMFFVVRVLQDPQDGQYHMWYSVHQDNTATQILYRAVSADGITWAKPVLQSDGSNRCAWADGSPWDAINCAVFHDPKDPDPARRYKLIYYKPSYYLAYSPDGTTWTPHSAEPVWPNGSGDGLEECFFFLPEKVDGKYRAYMRVWQRRHTLRTLSYGDSDDLIEWSGPKIIWQAGSEFGPGAQVYGMSVFIDHGVYWGMPWIFYSDEIFDARDQQTMRCRMLTSKDGLEWQSVFPDQDALPLGDPGSFDCEMIHTTCPVITVDGKRRLYYSGNPTKHHTSPRKPGGIGLAQFRSNGFVSLHAEDEGILLTRRFLFKGDQLRLNATTTPGGSVVAELISDMGNIIPGFGHDDADPFTGDATDEPLSWNGKSDLSAFTGQYLMLRLRVRQGDVFAYRAAGEKKMFAEASGPPPVRCGHCETAPVIDGIHNDDAWMDFTNSGVAEDFVQFEKNAPAAVRTRVMLTRDDENLYFAIDCEEPFVDKLIAEHEENEELFGFDDDDTIEIRLNAPQHGTFFNQLCVNAAGKRFQAWFSVDEGGSRVIPNVTWRTAVSQLPGHWYVEMAVPFTALNATPPAGGERWLMNIIRHRHTDGHDVSCWSCMFGRAHRNDLSGTLVFT